MKIDTNLKYALVLAGGGARGLVHVGVLGALEAAGFPRPALIAGTSMGAVVGGLYAAGVSAAELKRVTLEELETASFMESPAFRLGGPLGKLFVTGQFIGNFATRPGVDSGNKALALLERLAGGKRVEDCAIPFICNAVDIVSGREVVLDSGPLAAAMRASMSFPVFFEPVARDGMTLVDGGVLDNLPVAPAREAAAALGIARTLAVDTHGRWKEVPPESYKNGISVLVRCFDVLAHTLEARGTARADLTLRAADNSSVFDFSRKREIVALGEAAVRESAAELGAFFGRGPAAFFGRRKFHTCGIVMEGGFALKETGENAENISGSE